MILYVLAVAAALHDLAALEAQASAVAGTPVVIDRRLRLAECTEPVIARSVVGLSAKCTAPAWRIIIPAQTLTERPLIRRGDPVSVIAAGPGFRVTIEAIADSDAAVGNRLNVHDSSGAKLTAIVQPDGSLAAPGYNYP